MTRRSLDGACHLSAHARERGTTLVEAVLVMTLMVAVMSVLFGLFDAFTRSEHHHETTLDVRQELRQAMGEIEHDIHAATAIVPAASGVIAQTSLELSITDKAGTASMVRFRLDTTAKQLVREVITVAGGTAVSSRLLLRNVPPVSSATFRYFSIAGVELDPLALTPASLVSCVSRIQVDLHDSAIGGPTDLTQSLQVMPRSVRPEEVTCS